MLAPSGYLINNSRATNSRETGAYRYTLAHGNNMRTNLIYLALKAHHVASDHEPVPGAA